MDTNKEIQKESQTVPNQVQTQDQGVSLIEQANFAAERLERANIAHKSLLMQEAELYAKQKLGGRTDAGQVPIVQKEETPKEYAKRLWNGEITLK